MKKAFYFFIPLSLILCWNSKMTAQNIVENYQPKRNDSIKVGFGKDDFLPLIQEGFTLLLPTKTNINGVLIFLEDSKYDNKNNSAKQLYNLASNTGFAVVSVSTEIPLDFYFSETSILNVHNQLQKIFKTYNLPNKNIFFLGASLVGHRAMKYIEYVKKNNLKNQLNIKGLVICNFTMDWTRKWNQLQRDIKINKIDLWESKFINYQLEKNLKGTPLTKPENYHDFSSYSYFDQSNRNISFYKDFDIRVYIEPAIKYRLNRYYRTMYENNTTDMVGFLAELRLAGNDNTELIVLESKQDLNNNHSSQATWDKIDKKELMTWIEKKITKNKN